MSHTSNPSALDLERKLFAAGLWTYPATAQQEMIDLESIADGAVETWSQLTGYTPFLADAEDSTHYFATDGSPTVDMRGGFVTITSVAVNGNACTLNTDYRAFPLNAAVTGDAFTYLKFDLYWGRFISLFASLAGQTGPVTVTGRRGRVMALDNKAWNAILALGAMDVATEVEQLFSDGAIKSWKSGTTEEEYNQNPFAALVAGWQRVVDRALTAGGGFRRAQVG